MKKVKILLCLIMVCFVLTGCGKNNNANSANSQDKSVSEEAKQVEPIRVQDAFGKTFYGGEDLPVGDYVVIPNDATKSKYDNEMYLYDKESGKELIKDHVLSRVIVSLDEGVGLNVNNVTIYPMEQAPKVKQTGEYQEGWYKVGVDIPAGKYTIEKSEKGLSGTVYVYDKGYNETSNVSMTNMYGLAAKDGFTLKSGEYIKVSLGVLKED